MKKESRGESRVSQSCGSLGVFVCMLNKPKVKVKENTCHKECIQEDSEDGTQQTRECVEMLDWSLQSHTMCN